MTINSSVIRSLGLGTVFRLFSSNGGPVKVFKQLRFVWCEVFHRTMLVSSWDRWHNWLSCFPGEFVFMCVGKAVGSHPSGSPWFGAIYHRTCPPPLPKQPIYHPRQEKPLTTVLPFLAAPFPLNIQLVSAQISILNLAYTYI